MKYLKEKDYLTNFGTHLRVTRKKKGFSQERLAYESGIELRQIGRIERGEINTGILSVYLICQSLGVHPKELFDF